MIPIRIIGFLKSPKFLIYLKEIPEFSSKKPMVTQYFHPLAFYDFVFKNSVAVRASHLPSPSLPPDLTGGHKNVSIIHFDQLGDSFPWRKEN